MPNGNRSTDAEIEALEQSDDRVVVTKDRDFRNGHLLRQSPRRLLIVTTGNITNEALMALFDEHLDAIVAALGEARLVELESDRLVVHGDP